MRRARIAAGLAALMATMSSAPASAAVTPKIGTYSGHAAGAGSERIDLEVVNRGGAMRVRLLDFDAGCASQFVLTPIGAGKVRRGRFHFENEGNTNSVAYRTVLDGRFTSPTRATVTLQSFTGSLFPAPGTPPGAANVCSEKIGFPLKFLPDGL